MQRDIDEQLIRWSRSRHRLPLVLRGARQVGKTYALKHLGEAAYDSCAYVNLLDAQSREVFDEQFDAGQVLENIGVRTGVDIEPGRTLVIIDEIQEAPHALELMKAFQEEFPGQHIASAGSYLGIAYHSGTSFPVGKIQFLDMHPMSFLEFLGAYGDTKLAQWVAGLEFKRLEPFAATLERRLRQYYYVGGMPAAITAFLQGQGLTPDSKQGGTPGTIGAEGYRSARQIQNDLLEAYDADFSKHGVEGIDPERVRLAFRSIPTHLSRENHKFIFGHIAKGARSAQYDTAIQFIVDSGLATRVYRIGKLALPLRSYEDLSAFKLYLLDVGLLGAAMNIRLEDLITGDSGLEEYKGAMTEQYVCQQLVAAGIAPYYWSAPESRAEVDFALRRGRNAAPLEVKAEGNVHAKSLRYICGKTGLHGYRASMLGHREQDWLTDIPLWAVGPYFASEQ